MNQRKKIIPVILCMSMAVVQMGMPVRILGNTTSKEIMNLSTQVDKGDLNMNLALAKDIQRGAAPAEAFTALQSAIAKADGVLQSSTSTQAEVTQAIQDLKAAIAQFNLLSKIKDGVYTIGFKAYREGTKSPSSFESSFDPKVKLVVKNGRMKISMLNLSLAKYLLDFSVESNNYYERSTIDLIGQPAADGSHDLKIFTIPIADLSKRHSGAVLVSAMGGKPEEIGRYSVYTKLDLIFLNIRKGWEGYNLKIEGDSPIAYTEPVEQDMDQPGNEIDQVERVLVKKGFDKDDDGRISDEERNAIAGRLDLSGEGLTDISYLKRLTSKVTSLALSRNQIEELPEGLLDNLTELTTLYVSGNKIKRIPRDFFKNNAKLRTLYFPNNQLQAIQRNDVKGLRDIQELNFGNNQIEQIESGAFDTLTKMTSLTLNKNKLLGLPDQLLRPLSLLRFIVLDDNGLTNVPEDLAYATKIEKIYMKKNKVTHLEKRIFENLTALNLVDFRYNRIAKVDEGVFVNNSALKTVNLFDNDITRFTRSELPQGMNVGNTVLDLRLNNMANVDESFHDVLKKNKFNPQKAEANLQLVNEDNTLKWTQKLELLELFDWYTISASRLQKELHNINEYKEMVKKKGYEGQGILDILKDQKYDWDIQSDLQRKNEDDSFTNVSTILKSDVNDDLAGEFQGVSDGTYRLVKTVYVGKSGQKQYVFSVVSNEVVVKNEVVTPPVPVDTNTTIEGEGVQVVGNIGSAVKIEAVAITNVEEVNTLRKQLPIHSEAWFYDISLKDGLDTVVQPNGNVLVTLNLPRLNLNTFKVYHYVNGKAQEVTIVKKDASSVTFETSSFSIFALVKINDLTEDRKADANNDVLPLDENAKISAPTSATVSQAKGTTTNKGIVQTSDSTKVNVYVIIMLFSMMMLIAIRIKKKTIRQ